MFIAGEFIETPSVKFFLKHPVACLEVARLVRLARLARLARLVRFVRFVRLG